MRSICSLFQKKMSKSSYFLRWYGPSLSWHPSWHILPRFHWWNLVSTASVSTVNAHGMLEIFHNCILMKVMWLKWFNMIKTTALRHRIPISQSAANVLMSHTICAVERCCTWRSTSHLIHGHSMHSRAHLITSISKTKTDRFDIVLSFIECVLPSEIWAMLVMTTACKQGFLFCLLINDLVSW